MDVEFRFPSNIAKADTMVQFIQQMTTPVGFRIPLKPMAGKQLWGEFRQYKDQVLMFSLYKEDPMHYYYRYLRNL